mgnify:CR=1 FL=1
MVAGGMESMTRAPYVLPDAREGSRLGHAEMVDAMIHDGLWSTFTRQHMGESSDAVNAELGIGRQEQDAWAARSHQRANAGWVSGALAEEVVPVEVPQRKGAPVVVERDEGIRADSTPESLAALKPAFAEGGTITAGNASQISDGAAAGRGDEPGEGRTARPGADGRDRGARDVRRALLLSAHGAGDRSSSTRSRRPTSTSTTSACSRSTRPSRPSRCT